MPSAEPGIVSALPLADGGHQRLLAAGEVASALPSDLARPQSTTSVSPCLPTITLPGLMSRCNTPRQWAYSMALQTSVNRRRSLRRSSERAPGSASDRFGSVEAFDRLLEVVPLDEPHRVVGPAAVVGPQSVDGDDAGVLQAAGDLRLHQEPLAADRVVGVLVEDLLERHLAVQFAVERHEDGAQAASGMRPEDPEPLAVGSGGADKIGAGAVGVADRSSPSRRGRGSPRCPGRRSAPGSLSSICRPQPRRGSC